MTAEGSWASSNRARAVMKGNRSRDTLPELAIRRLLHAAGFRYRVDYQPVRGLRRRADIAFTRERVAVFVDGCFWHGCPEHFVPSKSNVEYWRIKIASNRARDIDTTMRLKADGWAVLRFWAHEDPCEAAEAVAGTVDARRAGRQEA